MKYVALFDYQAAGAMSESDLLWLAMANSDPRRDVKFLAGGELLLDARTAAEGAASAAKLAAADWRPSRRWIVAGQSTVWGNSSPRHHASIGNCGFRHVPSGKNNSLK